jgi:regulator of protease activity HflC (stomatin/prohibitin superfamily)
VTGDDLAGLFCTLGGGSIFLFIFLYVILLRGVFIVQPREAHILLYWGKYSRTVYDPGIHFAIPIGLARRVCSTRDQVFGIPLTTVVELHGNPIQVSAVCVYRVVDAARAVLDIQGYPQFVASQASTVLKAVCSRFPYESRNEHEPSLKRESAEIIHALTKELQTQVQPAGCEIALVRLNDLTYAPEIAQSMLLRQQALAMVDARRTLVEGAVETVREGIEKLSHSGLTLSEPVRLRLASHLTLLLCAGERGESHSTVISRQRHA